MDGTRGGRGAAARRAALPMLLAIAVLGVCAPGAFAWHGDLQVRKVNLGGPSNDVFQFKIEKTPNLYEDIWQPGYKTFDLFGAPSAAGPWIERQGSGPVPQGANMETFKGLFAGHDHGFDDWVEYTVTELSSSPSPLSDYTTTASCSIDGGDKWTSDNAVTAQYGKWSYSTGESGGQTYVSTSVRFLNDKSYVTTCTFVNRYRARVRVKKTFDDTVTAQPSVTALINGTARARAEADGTSVSPADTTLEHGQSTEWVKVPIGPGGPQSPVTIGEADGDAGDPPVSAYTTTIDCGAGITATLDAGTGQWTLAGIQPGQDVVCELHNVRKPVPPEQPPVTTTTTPTPLSGVLPTTPTSGTTPRGVAHLRGTVGCATAKYAQAYVTGARIQRVTFYVNGRKVKTLSKPNQATRYLLRYTVKPLRVGSYKVRARVEFTRASRTSPKTFNLQFNRCAVRGVSPTFTG